MWWFLKVKGNLHTHGPTPRGQSEIYLYIFHFFMEFEGASECKPKWSHPVVLSFPTQPPLLNAKQSGLSLLPFPFPPSHPVTTTLWPKLSIFSIKKAIKRWWCSNFQKYQTLEDEFNFFVRVIASNTCIIFIKDEGIFIEDESISIKVFNCVEKEEMPKQLE